jgi:hypothetical protein
MDKPLFLHKDKDKSQLFSMGFLALFFMVKTQMNPPFGATSQAAQATELAAIVPLILRGAWKILQRLVVTGTSIFPRNNMEKPMGFYTEVFYWWKGLLLM